MARQLAESAPEVNCPHCGARSTLDSNAQGDCERCGSRLFRWLGDPLGGHITVPRLPIPQVAPRVRRPIPWAKLVVLAVWLWMLHFLTPNWWMSAAILGIVLWQEPRLSWGVLILLTLGSALITAFVQASGGG